MARRAKRKTAKKKKTVRRAKKTRKSSNANKKAMWAAFRNLQKRVDVAFNKLKADVKKKAGPKVILKARNNLLLLLGECNYMSRECARLAAKAKAKKR